MVILSGGLSMQEGVRMAHGAKEDCYRELQEELEAMLQTQPFSLSGVQQQQLLSFLCLFLKQNRSLNLSAIVKPRDVMYLHVLDSWSIVPFLDDEVAKAARRNQPFRFVDLGTGAGFPGVPVKIVRPDVDLCLVDALAKRLAFLEQALQSIVLAQPWETKHARAEELGRDAAFREQFAFVTARALARLPVLLEYSLPLVQVGGSFCAMKAKVAEELTEAEGVAQLLGAELEQVEEFILPGAEAVRSLLIYRKVRPTPPQYPRPHAQIKKRPL